MIRLATCLLALFCFSVVSCTTPSSPPPAPAPAPPAKEAKTWPEKMQGLSKTLSALLPLVVSRARFNNEKNAAAIERSTEELKNYAHTLKDVPAPNEDPSMRSVSRMLDQDLSRALASLKNGEREYARQILNDTTSYCIQCHTQTSNGPEFPKLDLSLNEKSLAPLERAQLFAATRQFDRALESYRIGLSEPNVAKRDPFEWEQSVREALAIVVRVKKDPKATLAFLDQLESDKKTLESLPKSMREAIIGWRANVHEWIKEKPQVFRSPEPQVKFAESLIKRAEKDQAYPVDHSQDVRFFRAGALLHDFLQNRNEKDELQGRALLLAGLASEATRDMNFWTLHEVYYERCIRLRPHSKLAGTCYGKLRDSVVLGYSGSGGIRLPNEIAERLESLRSLSGVVPKKLPPKDQPSDS